MQWSDTDL